MIPLNVGEQSRLQTCVPLRRCTYMPRRMVKCKKKKMRLWELHGAINAGLTPILTSPYGTKASEITRFRWCVNPPSNSILVGRCMRLICPDHLHAVRSCRPSSTRARATTTARDAHHATAGTRRWCPLILMDLGVWVGKRLAGFVGVWACGVGPPTLLTNRERQVSIMTDTAAYEYPAIRKSFQRFQIMFACRILIQHRRAI